MPFPFASWEVLQERSELLPHMSVQLGEHLLQLVAPQPDEPLPTHENQLFFRSLGSREVGSFVITHPCVFPFHEYQMGVREFNDLTVAELSTQLDEALAEGSFARMFFLNADERLRQGGELARYVVVVGATGWGKWILLSATSNNGLRFQKGSQRVQTGSLRPIKDAAFQWTDAPDASHFLSTPALEIWATIETQKQEERSECAFARHALDIPNIGELVLRWNQSQHAELHRVLKAAFLSQTELWVGSKSYEWVVKLDKLNMPWHRGELIPLTGRHAGYFSNGPDELRDVLRRVSPYFAPLAKEKLLAPHFELARRQMWAENPLHIRVETPTAHERLEATLFWEEWQKSHPPIK